MIQNQISKSGSFTSETNTIQSYFSTLNQGQFELTASLFSLQGQLLPPFETPVVGQPAIASYLKQEAIDMSFNPIAETCRMLPNGQRDVEVRGSVSTNSFSVNVAWNFLLSAQEEIDLVKVNLLASLQELIGIRPHNQHLGN